jgi:hypothetical protein
MTSAAASPRFRSTADASWRPAFRVLRVFGSAGLDRFARGFPHRALRSSWHFKHRVSTCRISALTLLTTTTGAVHHRCITGTAFGDILRTRCSARNRMVEPKTAFLEELGRRIRLTGLLRKKPWQRGFFHGLDSPATRQAHPATAGRGLGGTARRGRPAWPVGRAGYEPPRDAERNNCCGVNTPLLRESQRAGTSRNV